MRKLKFQYRMQLSFSKPVNRHHFTLRCFPKDSERQQIENQEVKIEPSYDGGDKTDSFGNLCKYGVVEKEHSEFVVNVTGTVCVNGSQFQPVYEKHKVGMFRYHTALTKKGPTIENIYNKCKDKDLSTENFPYIPGISDADNIKNIENNEGSIEVIRRAYYFMNVVHDCLEYAPGITQVNTTAEEAATLGSGVCQDYSHIMLSLLRMEHIPCRYVAGMMMGEGASHAWVEVCDGEKWVAFDPTNNCMVDDSYICISNGRDAKDCTINQGYFYGLPEQVQEIHVLVENVEDEYTNI
ncbi:MAG: transglutaminase family protein [Lachnospiraceae bacterium]|nr:transglutaminase family protein [Lachnospiraceae bacterium]